MRLKIEKFSKTLQEEEKDDNAFLIRDELKCIFDVKKCSKILYEYKTEYHTLILQTHLIFKSHSKKIG